MDQPLKLLLTALSLLLIGVALPFMMILDLLESTFLLNALAFASSNVGLVIGFVGLAQYVRARR